MDTKQELINKINLIEDPDLLKEINRWISSMINISVPAEFSKDEIAAVHEGYKQYKMDDVITQDEANELFDKWLKEK
ncbi:MAG: hypothetical protein WEA58_01065 [Balneolaceae bacterium]